MKRDNKGFTLVELILAISISVIVLGAAFVLLGNAQKSYQVAEETIDLQKEAQILLERFGGFVMECNKVEVDGNLLILSRIPRNYERTDLQSYTIPKPKVRIFWMSGDKLYMKEYDNVVARPSITSDSIDDNCISEFIFSFVPTYNKAQKPQELKIELSLKEGSRQYSIENTFKIRNELSTK